jgi:Flp pilus assembly pilin Flp
MFGSVYALVGAILRAIVSPDLAMMRREEGQTTAEYALVILAAAAIAVVLIAWARSSGKLPDFFDNIIDQVAGSAS